MKFSPKEIFRFPACPHKHNSGITCIISAQAIPHVRRYNFLLLISNGFRHMPPIMPTITLPLDKITPTALFVLHPYPSYFIVFKTAFYNSTPRSARLSTVNTPYFSPYSDLVLRLTHFSVLSHAIFSESRFFCHLYLTLKS